MTQGQAKAGRTAMRLALAWGLALVVWLLAAVSGHGQYVANYVSPYVSLTGGLSSASGVAAQNATLTLSPSQVFFVAGTATVVTGAQCSTDNFGAVVGMGNPLSGAIVAASYVGSLPAGNYYTVIAWYDQYQNMTLASPEVARQLTSTGELTISPPSAGSAPPTAVGMAVYIGTVPGGEVLQGTTTSPTASFVQAAALTGAVSGATGLTPGAPAPSRNSSICQVVANDAGWPTGTGYQVSLVDQSGNPLITYPQMWQFYGPGSSYNLSSGIPYFHGQVTYPVPILSVPYNHNIQSISGPLSMTSYDLVNVGALGVGTSLPAYGVDVEGASSNGQINSLGGYLYASAAPLNHVLLGNGTAYVDSATIPASIISGLTSANYQTMASNNVAQTQRPTLNFTPRFVLTDSSSPAETTVDMATTGVVAGTYTYPASVTTDGYGRVTAISNGTATNRTCNSNGCYRIYSDGTIEQWGLSVTPTLGCSNVCGTSVVTFPYPFTTTANIAVTHSSNNCATAPCGSGTHGVTLEATSVSTTGYTIYWDGAGQNITSSPQAYWRAVGN